MRQQHSVLRGAVRNFWGNLNASGAPPRPVSVTAVLLAEVSCKEVEELAPSVSFSAKQVGEGRKRQRANQPKVPWEIFVREFAPLSAFFSSFLHSASDVEGVGLALVLLLGFWA